jgi:co-chaperonin GroES (HSP10)
MTAGHLSDQIILNIKNIPLTYAPDNVKDRGGFPIPLVRTTGRMLLIYQDQWEFASGKTKVIAPQQYVKRYTPTEGTILQIGEGFTSNDPEWDQWDCPYCVGDKVYWGKWEDRVISIDVLPDWWTEAEKEEFENTPRPNKKVEFSVIPADNIWGVVYC